MKKPNLQIIDIDEKNPKLMAQARSSTRSQKKNFPKCGKKYTHTNTRSTWNTKQTEQKNSQKHIIVRTVNIYDKESVLKAVKEKNVSHFKGKQIRVSWSNAFQVLKDYDANLEYYTQKNYLP